MFHDIFNKKVRKGKNRPKIIIDIHEKNSLVLAELVSRNCLDISIESLKVGDYLIGELVIERKTINDLVSSLLNKRIFEQIRQLKNNNKFLLMIEGNLNESYLDNKNIKSSIKGLLLSISLDNVPILFTKDYKDTVDYLILLSKKKKKGSFTLHSRIPKSILSQKKYILESFPNIGAKTSSNLLKKFKSLKQVFNADKTELKEILNKNTEEFRALLENNKDY